MRLLKHGAFLLGTQERVVPKTSGVEALGTAPVR